ncbi:glucoamylase [Enhydrobacter aerosaccus]|uniref:Glucoamylase n=1 Tax=Enhydrobacter aerosaccus TaxID=225324 RepID=A0A1T4NVJ8_9HYPH|nr:glycoside hydrolase family 15 protein [Enhydrobacter aerosaccus]SJZ83284.1 glucoamylase [Enhydrobacter aerosaccus]
MPIDHDDAPASSTDLNRLQSPRATLRGSPRTPREAAEFAPGAPGMLPTWASSAKDVVGTALGPSRLWFTIGYGIVNEVYYPRVDLPQIRDLGFIVGDGEGFWVEVKRLGTHRVQTPDPGIPAAEIVHTHERFRIRQRIAPDPKRDVLLIELTLEGDETLFPYALLAPHLGGTGHGNTATVYAERGHTVLAAEQGPFGLALAAVDENQVDAWGMASAGYVGSSDGWQDFKRNGCMSWSYRQAGPGNVALMGQLPRRVTLALAFGGSKEAAATLAISALVQDFAAVWDDHVSRWRNWHAGLDIDGRIPESLREPVRLSAMVLRTHQDKTFPGAMVASLSIPWGNSRDDIGGYHLVWPRDLVESALALVALGAFDEARDVLRYLIATQLPDGRWYQNQWLGGSPSWTGVQLDEVAWPVLLASALAERDALGDIKVVDMVRGALGFLIRTGPSSDQDRWEEISGINAFTLATCISALVAGAEFLDEPLAEIARAVADDWNASIEDWTAATGTPLAARFGAESYYVRCAPARVLEDRGALADRIPMKNRGPDAEIVAFDQVSTGFLQLVRFGLRRPDHKVVLDTLKVVDGTIKVDTPSGPVWYRYNGDGYGEREGGLPYLGDGIGRPWPLLTGERGHYALVAGADPLPYLEAMRRMAGRGGLFPEQVWDREALPAAFLYPGKPTGAAMPLVWAHAEFVKLATGLAGRVPVDQSSAVARRYGGKPVVPRHRHWSRRAMIRRLPSGCALRLVLEEPTVVRWTVDDWRQSGEIETRAIGLGLELAELPADQLPAGVVLRFTLRSGRSGAQDGRDYALTIG